MIITPNLNGKVALVDRRFARHWSCDCGGAR